MKSLTLWIARWPRAVALLLPGLAAAGVPLRAGAQRAPAAYRPAADPRGAAAAPAGAAPGLAPRDSAVTRAVPVPGAPAAPGVGATRVSRRPPARPTSRARASTRAATARRAAARDSSAGALARDSAPALDATAGLVFGASAAAQRAASAGLANATVPTAAALAAYGATAPAPPAVGAAGLRAAASTATPTAAGARAARTPAELVAAAVYEYRTTGRARPLALPGGVAYPFGVGAPPVLQCAVLRACVVELEPGETLTAGPIRGDKVRWVIDTARSGADGGTTLVWVKPKDCDLSTNLVLPTDRRVYYLALESPACDARSTNPRGAYVSRVQFYYPEGAGAPALASAAAPAGASGVMFGSGGARTRWAADAGATVEGAAAPAFAGIVVDVTRMQFDYTVRREKRFPWAPTQLFDDGAHTFIKLPPEADAYAAPALFEVDDAGNKTLLNYVVRDGFYVTDRTFRRAVLVLGQGKQEQRIEIENRAFGRPAAARPTNAPAQGGPR